jgi:hypothetical protein
MSQKFLLHLHVNLQVSQQSGVAVPECMPTKALADARVFTRSFDAPLLDSPRAIG